MTSSLFVHKLNADHIGDMYTLSTRNVPFYYYVGTGGGFNYNNTTCVFETTTPGAGAYDSMSVSCDEIDLSGGDAFVDVEAVVRTVDIIENNQFAINTAGLQAFFKTGINKQVSLDVAGETPELYSEMVIYEDNANVSDLDSDPIQFANYQYPEDINENVHLSRLNGARNFRIQEIPLSTKITESFSVKIKMTNDGAIYDMHYVMTPTKVMGGE